MSVEALREQLAVVTDKLAGLPLDKAMESSLNEEFGAGSDVYQELVRLCREGVAEGWLCDREAGGIGFGRIFKPSEELQGFSVDVVNMNDIVGPHHAHPNGEVDLIMPEDDAAEFDGHGAGWLVYSAGSQHSPTVNGGRALVLYLLPDGKIEFTRN